MPITGWEHGSNYSVGQGGFSGLQELASSFSKFAATLSGPVMREALWRGAEVVKSAMEAATPVGSQYEWKDRVTGRVTLVKDKHPGQAKNSVIIYEAGARTYTAGNYAKGIPGQFYTSLTMEGFVEGTGSTRLLVGYEKSKAFYMYFVEHGYTAHRAGDVVVRTRAGGKSSTKHFRPEDLFFPLKSSSKSTKGAWGKPQFGRAINRMEATGGYKVPAHPIPFNADSALQKAEMAIAQALSSRIGGMAA